MVRLFLISSKIKFGFQDLTVVPSIHICCYWLLCYSNTLLRTAGSNVIKITLWQNIHISWSFKRFFLKSVCIYLKSWTGWKYKICIANCNNKYPWSMRYFCIEFHILLLIILTKCHKLLPGSQSCWWERNIITIFKWLVTAPTPTRNFYSKSRATTLAYGTKHQYISPSAENPL